MCGILLHTKCTDSVEFANALDKLRHRGPDENAISNPMPGVFLGHTRLSILDLSPLGAQPMKRGDIEISFNGEIYNFKELIKKHNLDVRSSGDTEVLAALWDKLGPVCISQLDGEFAFVVIDKKNKTVYAVRDPLGIKQLYFYNGYRGLIISSELKAIQHFVPNSLDEEEWKNYLWNGFSTNTTLFKGIDKVHPGIYWKFSIDSPVKSVITGTYYAVPHSIDVTTDKITNKFDLQEALTAAVRKRMISDVPVSATLSGGLDSSIIVALMAEMTDRVKTYTIGFDGIDEFDEASLVADYFGTDHMEVRIPLDQVLEDIEDIVRVAEEPMDKGSLIPTYYLAKAVKEKVTLIGEGADECFGGYNRHQSDLPHSAKAYLDESIRVFPDNPLRTTGFGDYDPGNPNTILRYDLTHEIPNFHNPRIDKMFMNNSVEARVPYLDPEVVKLAMSIPFSMKEDPKKQILRHAFITMLPPEAANRPKKALKIPTVAWVERKEIKDVIMNSPLFDRTMIENIYATNPKDYDWFNNQLITIKRGSKKYVRNKGRMLWLIYLATIWHEINFK